MGNDHFLRLYDASFTELQRQYHARGFTGVSFDANVLRQGQAWRLLDGAEPPKWLSIGAPAAHMRYGPYRTVEDV